MPFLSIGIGGWRRARRSLAPRSSASPDRRDRRDSKAGWAPYCVTAIGLSPVRVERIVECLPPTLAGLVADLDAVGFVVTEDTSSSWEWRQVTTAKPGGPVTAVRLFRDRGLWGVEVAIDGEFHNPYDVLLALAGSEHKARALNHAERRAMTLEVLDRLPADPARIAEIRSRLRRNREDRTRRMSGG